MAYVVPSFVALIEGDLISLSRSRGCSRGVVRGGVKSRGWLRIESWIWHRVRLDAGQNNGKGRVEPADISSPFPVPAHYHPPSSTSRASRLECENTQNALRKLFREHDLLLNTHKARHYIKMQSALSEMGGYKRSKTVKPTLIQPQGENATPPAPSLGTAMHQSLREERYM